MSRLIRYKDLGVLVLRLAFGVRLVYGTIDNLISYEQMLEFKNFLDAHGFPFPLISAFASVILQFLAGLGWIVGYKVRILSALMIANFTIAIFAVHIGDAYLNTAPAIHLLAVSTFLLFNGAGKYGLDK